MKFQWAALRSALEAKIMAVAWGNGIERLSYGRAEYTHPIRKLFYILC